jgi:hypothetical protein
MLVILKQKDFEMLDDISLIWTCIQPTIQNIRAKNFTIKLDAYSMLTDGQKALLMFQIMYGHTMNNVEEFFHLHYILSNYNFWLEMKNGMDFFNAHDMKQFIDEMYFTYELYYKNCNICLCDIEKNSPLFFRLSWLNKSYSDILPLTIILVASYIRNNSKQFVKFVDNEIIEN